MNNDFVVVTGSNVYFLQCHATAKNFMPTKIDGSTPFWLLRRLISVSTVVIIPSSSTGLEKVCVLFEGTMISQVWKLARNISKRFICTALTFIGIDFASCSRIKLLTGNVFQFIHKNVLKCIRLRWQCTPRDSDLVSPGKAFGTYRWRARADVFMLFKNIFFRRPARVFQIKNMLRIFANQKLAEYQSSTIKSLFWRTWSELLAEYKWKLK